MGTAASNRTPAASAANGGFRAGTAGTDAGGGTGTADADDADDSADGAGAGVTGGGVTTGTWRLIGSAPDGGRTLPDGVFVVGSIDASMRMGDGAGVAIVRVISDDAHALSVASADLNSSAVW